MKKRDRLALPLLALLIFTAPQALYAQNHRYEFYLDESAAGARGSMGLFANGYSRALATEAFGFKPNTLKNRLASALLAAASYQILSFDKDTGLQTKPLQWNKQWHGYWQGYFSAEGIDVFLGLVKKYNGLKFLFGSTLAAAAGVMVIEGESRQTWRYADDGPLTLRKLMANRHSYWIHFAGSGGLYWAFSRQMHSQELALAYTTFFIWMWEIKDGYIRWENVGFLGGDGFSWADGWAGSIAAVGSYLFGKLLTTAGSREKSLAHANTKSGHRQKKLVYFFHPGVQQARLSVHVRF